MEKVVTDTDVLIVGAGPVGLFLAHECARRGLRWRLIEKRASQSEHSRALAIFPRTLEIFAMAGIVDVFLEVANRVDTITLTTRRRALASVPFVPDDSPYPFVAMVPQNLTERLLAQTLAGIGDVPVEYLGTFESAEQNEEVVQVRVRHGDEVRNIRTRFLAGCDGAHSTVRQWLELPFEGGDYHEQFMLADIATDDTMPANRMMLCPHRNGPLALFPMSQVRHRIVAMVHEAEGEAPSLTLVRRLLAERAPAGIEAEALHWSSYFHIHHRCVAHLRRGRVFLAGDAAHVHSPFGGQGMNTGLHDAWNLAWKLDLFLHGHGNEMLLDSYEAERMPVIRRVIDTTHLLTLAMGTPNRWAEASRNILIPAAARLPAFRHALVRRLSGLDIAYRGSPIVEGSGARCVDDSIRDARNPPGRFLLLLGNDAEAALVEAARRFTASCGDLVELRQTQGSGAALVRPDGYLAYSGAGTDSGVIASMRTLLTRQTTTPAGGSRRTASTHTAM